MSDDPNSDIDNLRKKFLDDTAETDQPSGGIIRKLGGMFGRKADVSDQSDLAPLEATSGQTASTEPTDQKSTTPTAKKPATRGAFKKPGIIKKPISELKEESEKNALETRGDAEDPLEPTDISFDLLSNDPQAGEDTDASSSELGSQTELESHVEPGSDEPPVEQDVLGDEETVAEEARATPAETATDFLAALRSYNSVDTEAHSERETETVSDEQTSLEEEAPTDEIAGAEETEPTEALGDDLIEAPDIASSDVGEDAEMASDDLETAEPYEEEDTVEESINHFSDDDGPSSELIEPSKGETGLLPSSGTRTATFSVTIDNERLEDVVADLIRKELSGQLGEQITDVIRHYVEAEVERLWDEKNASTSEQE
ncbi:MAG: hypothetical protein AAGJ34_12835 [Pseudomonadota bacterium]